MINSIYFRQEESRENHNFVQSSKSIVLINMLILLDSNLALARTKEAQPPKECSTTLFSSIFLENSLLFSKKFKSNEILFGLIQSLVCSLVLTSKAQPYDFSCYLFKSHVGPACEHEIINKTV